MEETWRQLDGPILEDSGELWKTIPRNNLETHLGNIWYTTGRHLGDSMSQGSWETSFGRESSDSRTTSGMQKAIGKPHRYGLYDNCETPGRQLAHNCKTAGRQVGDRMWEATGSCGSKVENHQETIGRQVETSARQEMRSRGSRDTAPLAHANKPGRRGGRRSAVGDTVTVTLGDK